VDNAKHRRGEADAHRERDDGHQREARTAPEYPPAVTEVIQQAAHTELLVSQTLTLTSLREFLCDGAV
jgi:hypothetical protein